ncbi:MAG: YabP/YqfC family sporulation protein [Lachnospiraceae bacterium]|nr:YabP/YqfC family sporulation protein [Lachnospiraceae bacterium]
MSDYDSYKQNFIQKMQLPQDVFEGATMISLVGRHEVTVENYKALLDYSDTQIRLQGKRDVICILGDHLEIYYFTNADMKIVGNIDTISYV